MGARRMWAVGAVLGIALSLPTAALAGVPRSGFSDEHHVSVHLPTSIAFLPDGTMLTSGLYGKITAIAPDRTKREIGDLGPVLCTGIERGFARVAVDPEFSVNRFVYVTYTRKRQGVGCDSAPLPANRVSRFRLLDDLTLDMSSERVLIDELVAPGKIHNGGDLAFGKDGYLYVSTGDGGCDYANHQICGYQNDNARDRHTLLGKILRIDRDGNVPPDNPNMGSGSVRCNTGPGPVGSVCQEWWATGLRNPFRFAMDPNASGVRFFINDVGHNHWEEVNSGARGADYGWNLREGPCSAGTYTNCSPAAGMTDPAYAYRHNERDCTSITGGAFVPAAAWPPPFAGTYVFADFTCNTFFRLTPTSGGYSRETFMTDSVQPIHLEFGPVPDSRPALYYATFHNGGEVRRIRYTGPDNRAPQSALKATPTSGSLPLEVAFDASASKDPDGDALTYRFDFGDGSDPVVTSDPHVRHTYTSKGHYNASVLVRDPAGLRARDEVRIDAGYLAPRVEIVSPSPDFRFSVGESIPIQARATDPEDGALASTDISITVRLRHADHRHPFAGPTDRGSLTIQGPAPEDTLAATNSLLEIRATATDSDGVSTTLVQNLHPKKIRVLLESNRNRVPTTVNGTAFPTPASVTSWAGWRLTISVPERHEMFYKFQRWHDGLRTRTRVETPTQDTGVKSFYVFNLF